MRNAPLAALAASIVSAQIYPPGPQVVTFLSGIDDTSQPYALYVPRNYDPSKKYPLVISLHDAGSNHRLNLRRVFGQGNRPGETEAEAARYFPRLKEVGYIVASPLARGTMGYQGIAERDVYDVVADVKRKFGIDEDRIYLTGIEMGGGGTLWLGLTRPDVWAAIAPVCPEAPPGTENLVENALNVAVKLFQGELDPLIKAERTRRWYKEFLDAGTNVTYLEYGGVRHNAWDYAYKDAAIFDWFGQYRRNKFPDRVRFAARDYGHDAAYWVTFDRLMPGTLASIDAKFTGKNHVSIQTKDLGAFTLRLAGHPMFVRSQIVVVDLDSEHLRARPGDTISFTRERNRWIAKHYVPLPHEKRAGQEGPISQAMASRQLYVYGTGGAPSIAELQRRRDEAVLAASWSSPRSVLLVNFPVVSDSEVKEADWKSSNLILFGTKETNSQIARIAAQAPVALNPGAADFGLVFIIPTGFDHYAAINSGLVWWTRADQAHRTGLPVIPSPFHAVATFGDYILFKGGLDNVIAEGNFDQFWKVPSAEVAKMRATGAVALQ